ncbi:M48 family metalloprotease [Halosimplex pelagicum]|uniref:M48 family metalloprotease n=1 Tax=Halosimplex pelagicum TaxID=869886 RepID=A0A7D5TVJ3_9EURY|nr:M48 family metalloprotease [Halosimplex pelagicum]QLH83254.1 M48 family metalloprotease [Halosimplex pelagicum]
MQSRLVAVGAVALVCSAALLAVGVAAVDAQESGGDVTVPDADAVIVDISPDGPDTVTVFLPTRTTDDPVLTVEEMAARAPVPARVVSVREVDARVTRYVDGNLVDGGELYRLEILTDLDERTGPLSGTVSGDTLAALAPTDTPAFVVDVPAGTAVDRGSVRSRSFSSTRYEWRPSGGSLDGPITYRFPTSTVGLLAALLLASLLGSYGAVRYRARSVADGPEPLTERVHAVRGTKANALLVGPAAAVAVALWLGSVSLVSLVAGWMPSGTPSGAWWTVTRWTVALAPFACSAWLGATFGAEPVVRDLIDAPFDPLVVLGDWAKSAFYRVARYWVAGAVLLTLAPHILETPLVGGVAVTLLVVLDWLVTPVAIRVFNDTAPIPGEFGREVTEFCDRQGVSVRGVRRLDTGDARHANGIATGMVGYHWVFLTDDLLDELDPDQIRAIVAHELGHLDRRHLLKQAAFTLGFWSLAFVAFVHVYTELWLFVVAVWVYTQLGLGWIGQGQEYQADDYAAEATSPDALAGALDRLATVNFALRDTGVAHNYAARHPSIEDRIARLRDDSEPDEATDEPDAAGRPTAAE